MGGNVKLTFPLVVDGVEKALWFLFNEDAQKYLAEDRSDGPLVALLYYCMKNGLDIKSDAKVSEKLYYQLVYHVIPVLVKKSGGKLREIKIHAVLTNERYDTATINATGLSCGVDSFYSIFEHNELSHDDNYAVSLVTCFNHGSYNGAYEFSTEKMRSVFEECSEKNAECAEKMGLQFLKVDTNLDEIDTVPFGFDHTFRASGSILLFQRGIKRYYYAAGVDIDEFKINVEHACGYMDLFLLPNFSTETLSFYSQGESVSRNEKVEKLISYPVTYKYLQVCVSDTGNCSHCPKCHRTMRELYAFGAMDKYKNVFDIEYFNSHKVRIFAEMLMWLKKDAYERDTYELMKHRNIKIPLSSYLLVPCMRFAIWLKNHAPEKAKQRIKQIIRK